MRAGRCRFSPLVAKWPAYGGTRACLSAIPRHDWLEWELSIPIPRVPGTWRSRSQRRGSDESESSRVRGRVLTRGRARRPVRPSTGRAVERHSAAPTETGNAVTAWNEIAVGDAAHPSPRSRGWCTACGADSCGDGAGGGVRRSQCDRAEAPRAIPPGEAFLVECLEGRCRRDRGVRRPARHRGSRAEHGRPPGESCSVAVVGHAVRRRRRRDSQRTVEGQGHQGWHRGGAVDDLGTS